MIKVTCRWCHLLGADDIVRRVQSSLAGGGQPVSVVLGRCAELVAPGPALRRGGSAAARSMDEGIRVGRHRFVAELLRDLERAGLVRRRRRRDGVIVLENATVMGDTCAEAAWTEFIDAARARCTEG